MSDAAELEREAEAARARLSDTADQIRARMSPGQMMDEVLNQFRGGDGSQMFANLRDQARDNPMALALVGSGLAWLMMGSQGARPPSPSPSSGTGTGTLGTYRQEGAIPGGSRSGTGTFGTYRQESVLRDGSSAGGEPASAMGSTTASTTGAASRSHTGSAGSQDEGGLASATAGMATDMARGASDAFASARSTVGDGLHEAGDRAQRMAHDLRDAGSDAIGGFRHSASGVSHQARDTFFDVLEREPLVIGAIGLAVGAAIGAFLPATTMEREHLGSTGEALKEKAEELADRGMAKAKEAAAEVYETARDAADREGLLPGDKPVAEKVDSVVHAVGETVGGIAERNAPGSSSSEAGTGSGTARALAQAQLRAPAQARALVQAQLRTPAPGRAPARAPASAPARLPTPAPASIPPWSPARGPTNPARAPKRARADRPETRGRASFSGRLPLRLAGHQARSTQNRRSKKRRPVVFHRPPL